MISIPSEPQLASMSRPELQQLCANCATDIADTSGCDSVTAWKKAKLSYPSAFAALAQIPMPANQPESALPAPGSVTIPSQENGAKLGLACNFTPDEYNAAARAVGNNPDTQDHDKAFDALADFKARNSNLSPQEAAAATAMRHPNLKRKSDTAKVKKELQKTLPETIAPGAAIPKNPAPSGPGQNLFRKMASVSPAATEMAMANSRDRRGLALSNSSDVPYVGLLDHARNIGWDV